MEVVRRNNDAQTRNFVFVGATGSGKSSTANSILERGHNMASHAEYFIVGEDVASCTFQINDAYAPNINVKLIDTPDFGDTSQNEPYIEELLNALINRIRDISGKSTGNIDAFILVTKLTPRAATLKQDIERMKNIFGRISLKSTILLVIDAKESPRDPESIYAALAANGVKEALKPLVEQKDGTSMRDWTLCWDNMKPREGQFDALMKMISKLEPYTHQKFLDAQEEIKEAINARVTAELEKQTKALRREFADDQEIFQMEIEKMKKEKEEERRKAEEARQRIEADMQGKLNGIMQNNTATIQKILQEQAAERENQQMFYKIFQKEKYAQIEELQKAQAKYEEDMKKAREEKLEEMKKQKAIIDKLKQKHEAEIIEHRNEIQRMHENSLKSQQLQQSNLEQLRRQFAAESARQRNEFQQSQAKAREDYEREMKAYQPQTEQWNQSQQAQIEQWKQAQQAQMKLMKDRYEAENARRHQELLMLQAKANEEHVWALQLQEEKMKYLEKM